jgi:tyrosine-protein phosphatase SIW14
MYYEILQVASCYSYIFFLKKKKYKRYILRSGPLNCVKKTTTMETKHLLVPPLNFALVMPGIYRSGFFNTRNYRFLKQSLIKSVVHVSVDGYAEHKIGEDNLVFMKENNIRMFKCPLNPHKDPFAHTEEFVVAEALSILLDTRNHPVLVHDDKGKHRAGVLIGCLRKIQGWSLASIFHEYSLFTMGSLRFLDMQWVELFSHPVKMNVEFVPKWLSLENDLQKLNPGDD